MEKEKLVKKLLEVYLEIGIKDNKICSLLDEVSDMDGGSINGDELEKIAKIIEEIMGLDYGVTEIDGIEYENDGLSCLLNDIVFSHSKISIDEIYEDILKAVEYQQNK